MRSLKPFFHGAVFFMLLLALPAVCGAQWTNWAQINTNGFGNTSNFSAFSMAVFFRLCFFAILVLYQIKMRCQLSALFFVPCPFAASGGVFFGLLAGYQ